MLAATLAACSSSSSSSSTTATTSAPATTSTTSALGVSTQYYVSLGDSYAAGYQPTSATAGHTTTNGYAYQLPPLLVPKGYNLELKNFGCAGATTKSIIATVGCKAANLGPGATPYPTQTQAAAAEKFITDHPGQIGLITVSISGNDVTACAQAANPISCVGAAVTTIQTNLGVLLTGLRSAAGPSVPIVGLTYPDVLLGAYVNPGTASSKAIASESVTAFQLLINPALKKQYTAVGATFVDVTQATGAYLPFSQTTTLVPYGTIPQSVANVCQLTFYCQWQNIHPRTSGYTAIANQIAASLPQK